MSNTWAIVRTGPSPAEWIDGFYFWPEPPPNELVEFWDTYDPPYRHHVVAVKPTGPATRDEFAHKEKP